ncbi:MAG: hypothetical protein DMG91_15060 [Acidobacteria bacterium]|nr:MAG: hypothetical protein DMG91_15060 [Acidobacteriota bacterium]
MDWQAFWLTLRLGVLVAGVLLLLGLPLAYWITYTRWRWKFLIEAVVALPIVLPPTVLGFYLLIILGPRGLPGRMWQALTGRSLAFSFGGLLIGSILYSLPGVTRTVSIDIYDKVQALDYAGANQTALVLLVISFLLLTLVYGLNRRRWAAWPWR